MQQVSHHYDRSAAALKRELYQVSDRTWPIGVTAAGRASAVSLRGSPQPAAAVTPLLLYLR